MLGDKAFAAIRILGASLLIVGSVTSGMGFWIAGSLCFIVQDVIWLVKNR
jgi:hypothetical protein